MGAGAEAVRGVFLLGGGVGAVGGGDVDGEGAGSVGRGVLGVAFDGIERLLFGRLCVFLLECICLQAEARGGGLCRGLLRQWGVSVGILRSRSRFTRMQLVSGFSRVYLRGTYCDLSTRTLGVA